MRVRALVLCVFLIGAALGAAGCSSGGSSKPVLKPTGTVTVRSGNKVVCVITLDKNGHGTCTVSTAGYVPGKVTYVGTYNGSLGFKEGQGTATVTLLPAKPDGPVVSATASASS